MNAEDLNISVSKPDISMVEAVGSNPAPAPPKSNKRKNHRGGRKTKKKQNSSTGQDTTTTHKNAAIISTTETTVPILTKKQKQKNRKRCRKSAKAPTETTTVAPHTVPERQDGVTTGILKQDYVSPTVQDVSLRPCHRAPSSTQEPFLSHGVDEDTSARAETSEAISAAEQDSVSTGEGALADMTIYGTDGLEARFKSFTTIAEASQADGTPLFDIRPTPGKGIGMYTTGPIACGTRLLSQSALMLLDKDEDLLDVPLKFVKLSTEEQETFLGLAATPLEKLNRNRSEMLLLQRALEPEKASELPMGLQERLLSIVETNSFAADTRAVIVATAARMNHSCTPNVYHCWNAGTGQLTVHATRDLRAGEEILTCYVNVCFYHEARQKELDRYGFKCDCAACCMQTEFGRTSEERRQRLCALNREIIMKCMTSDCDFERSTLKVVLQMIEIMREEGLTNMELTRHYCMAADLNESLGDNERACEWARRALELTKVCTGTDYVAHSMNEENLRRLVEIRDGVMGTLRAKI